MNQRTRRTWSSARGEVRLQGSSTELRATQLTDTVLSEIVKALSLVKVTTKFLGTRYEEIVPYPS